jgi:hypothetical protein
MISNIYTDQESNKYNLFDLALKKNPKTAMVIHIYAVFCNWKLTMVPRVAHRELLSIFGGFSGSNTERFTVNHNWYLVWRVHRLLIRKE